MSTQSETVTVRLSPEMKSRLDDLATRTRRTKSFLAGEAITAYVEREMQIIEGILEGLEDMATGQVIPHDEAMKQLRNSIANRKKLRA